MKINPNVNRIGYKQSNLSNQQKKLAGNIAKDKVSFCGAKSGLVDIMDFIQRKGFFAEFLIIDFLSMIAPRILIGLNRDKDKTGKINYKAGAEEAGRELLSGPSMFLIPMGIFHIAKHYAPATKIPRDTLKELSSTLDEVIKNTKDKETLNDGKKLSKTLADKLFDRAFADFELDDKNNFKSKFSEIINTPHSKEKAQEFEDLIVSIKNKNKNLFPVNDDEIKLGEKARTGAKELYEDFGYYSKDIVNKFTKQNFAEKTIQTCKNEAETFLNTLQKSRSLGRLGTSITSFFAVGAFLLALPKLYLVSKISPAMDSANRAKKAAATKGGANENQ